MEMGRVKKLDDTDYFYRILAVLFNVSSEVAVVNYPKNPNRRSLDAVAVLKNGRRIFIKITYDAVNVSKAEASELVDMARVLDAAPLIVSEYMSGIELSDGVAYERHGVRIVSSNTLRDVASGRSNIYVYQSKDVFKVSIDSERMKRLRLDKGLSLGDVAYVIGTTRKTIYEYEKGSMEPTVDKAERLVSILGDEILKPLDLFEPPKKARERGSRISVDVEEERLIVDALKRHGYDVFHARRTTVDVGGSLRSCKLVFIVHRRKEKESRLLERVVNAEKISSIAKSDSYVVTEDEEVARDLRKSDFAIVRPGEVESLVKSYTRMSKS